MEGLLATSAMEFTEIVMQKTLTQWISFNQDKELHYALCVKYTIRCAEYVVDPMVVPPLLGSSLTTPGSAARHRLRRYRTQGKATPEVAT